MSDTTSGLSAKSTAPTDGRFEGRDALLELLDRHVEARRQLDRAAVLGDDQPSLAGPDNDPADVVEEHRGAGLSIAREVDAGPHAEAAGLADDGVPLER